MTTTPAVLCCPECGVPVPLGGATTECQHCGTRVPLPSAYRELIDEAARYEASRSTARALLERLSRPPGVFVRFLANAHGGTVIWLVTLGSVLSAVLVQLGFALAARLSRAWFHVDLDDVVLSRFDPNAIFLLTQFAVLLGGLGSLIVLGAYAQRRGRGLRELQAGLSARLPERKGEPVSCRQCGGPLSAPSTARFVTCTYCRADNLVHLPERWLAVARKQSKKLAGAVEEAARGFQEEAQDLRRSLLVRLAVVLGISAVVLFLLGGMTEWAKLSPSTDTVYHRSGAEFYSFEFEKAVLAPAFTLDRADARGCRGLGCVLLLSQVPCAERSRMPLVVPEGACDAEACTLHWYVALQRGAKLQFSATTPPAKSFVTLKAHARGEPFHGDAARFGEKLEGQFEWLADGTTVTLTAPHAGWFQLLLGLGEPATGSELDLCVVGP